MEWNEKEELKGLLAANKRKPVIHEKKENLKQDGQDIQDKARQRRSFFRVFRVFRGENLGFYSKLCGIANFVMGDRQLPP